MGKLATGHVAVLHKASRPPAESPWQSRAPKKIAELCKLSLLQPSVRGSKSQGQPRLQGWETDSTSREQDTQSYCNGQGRKAGELEPLRPAIYNQIMSLGRFSYLSEVTRCVRPGLLILSIADILDRTLLCGGPSCALLEAQQQLWPLLTRC